MRDNLVEQIISDVMNKQTDISPEAKTAANFAGCGITEFVGTALGHTIGLVIANVDNQLHEVMNIDKKYRSIGILGARTGAGPQIFAADEAIKATNSEIISIELARDTEGGGGHGCLIILVRLMFPTSGVRLKWRCLKLNAPWVTFMARQPDILNSSTPLVPATR